MKQLLALGLTLAIAAPTLASENPAKVDFAAQVEPILAESCYKCHGEKRGLGDLRVHTPELIAGMEDDGLVVAGDPESSEFYSRLTLPEDDELRMPKGSPPLDAEKVELVRLWIEQGAEVTAGATPKADEHKEPELPTPPAASEAALARLRSEGATVAPLFGGTTLLSVSFPTKPAAIDDSIFDALAPIAANIDTLDLGRSQVTDSGVQRLAEMTNLARLHLQRTGVGDAAIGAISGLKRLEYLNLYGAQITDAALAELESAPGLKKLYVWQTAVTLEAARKLEATKPGLEVNLGWDHPGVVRERANKELERVTRDKDAAEEMVKKAEAELEDAKAKLESASSRIAELEAELTALDEPAAPAETEEPAE